MATDKRGVDVSLQEVRLALDRSLADADAARCGALAGLGRVRTAKSALLESEQARLRGKYGANDERTLAVSERAEVNRLLLQQVTAEATRAAVDTPAPDPRAWILHGRVLDAHLQGVPALTAALYDEKGNWLREIGYACTDKTGHFLLSVKTDRAATASGADKADAKQMPVFLRVLDAKGATLHSDTEPLAPAPGRVDFRQIVLGGPPAQCAPPDGDKTPGPTRSESRPADSADTSGKRKTSRKKPDIRASVGRTSRKRK